MVGIKELEPIARNYEADPIDRVILRCYRLIDTCEGTISDEQTIKAISHETFAWTLREIADRAFAVGWTTKTLTSIQRAQILDILLKCQTHLVSERLKSFPAPRASNIPRFKGCEQR